MRDRLVTLIGWLEAGAAAGNPHIKKRVDAGEATLQRRRLKYLDDARADFTGALR